MALTMNMSDYDLTDRYADERSSVASSQAGRHPRGDSPLTIYKSDTDGSVTGGSSRGSCSGRTTVELPSLDRLMAFLDDDEENDAAENDNTRPLGAFRDGQGVEEAGMVDSGRSIDTERRASPLRSPQRTELDQQPLSSTPPLSAASATQRTRALNQELPRSSWDSQRSPSPINGDANGTRPSRSPPASHSHVNDVHVSSSYLRPPPLPPHSQSAPSPSAHGTELTEGATRTEADGISHTAGSPSPRPGSMAELRRSLSALGVRESDVDDEPGHGHDERGHPDERDARQRERSDGEDSVTRLAEDVRDCAHTRSVSIPKSDASSRCCRSCRSSSLSSHERILIRTLHTTRFTTTIIRPVLRHDSAISLLQHEQIRQPSIIRSTYWASCALRVNIFRDCRTS